MVNRAEGTSAAKPLRDPISVRRFIAAIRRLPPDRPKNWKGKWYTTQHEHWLGWLSDYHTPGAYGRSATTVRDARYAYNHIVEVEMLFYLGRAAGVSRTRLALAREDASRVASLMAKSAAFRKQIPWAIVARKLWPDYQLSQ